MKQSIGITSLARDEAPMGFGEFSASMRIRNRASDISFGIDAKKKDKENGNGSKCQKVIIETPIKIVRNDNT